MARVPYIDPAARPDLAPLVERFSGARRGQLINVYRMLLNSPGLAETWFQHINAVRWNTTLSGRIREMVIIRVGYVCNAPYIIKQHVPKLAEPEGLTAEECAEIADWRAATCFTEAERATLAYTDAVSQSAAADDALFDTLQQFYDDTAVVELTVAIATYNMHARVVNALKLDLEQD